MSGLVVSHRSGDVGDSRRLIRRTPHLLPLMGSVWCGRVTPLARWAGFEPATFGFGDRCSTVELPPYVGRESNPARWSQDRKIGFTKVCKRRASSPAHARPVVVGLLEERG